MTLCPQCGYERTTNDDKFVRTGECPKCGIIYKKWKPFPDSKNMESVLKNDDARMIITDEEYRLKYLKSGLFFSFALATTFLPILLGIECGYHVFIEVFGIFLLTSLNYVYIALVKDSRWRRWNIPVLILLISPLNIIFMFFVVSILRLNVEGNVAAFSMLMLLLPWFILIVVASVKHQKTLVTAKEKQDCVVQIDNSASLTNIRPIAILLSLVCFSLFHFTCSFFAKPIKIPNLAEYYYAVIINGTTCFSFWFWIVAGLIAALIGRRSGILHGAIFGVFSLFIIAFRQIISNGVIHPYFYFWATAFVKATTLGGIGGFVGDLYHRLRNRYIKR